MPQGLNAGPQNFLSEVWSAIGTGDDFRVWSRPRGHTMAMMLAIGGGGNGGIGWVGANSTAAGGGGGSSGNQSRLIIPLYLIPSLLYVSAPGPTSIITNKNALISIEPDFVVNHKVLIATGGGGGAAGFGATAGAAGVAAAVDNVAACPISGMGVTAFLAGQNGIIGGDVVSGANLTLPVTGLVVTGGTGGGGLPAAAAAGTSGGSFTVPASPSPFPPLNGGVGSATATNPAAPGDHGYNFVIAGVGYFYGGCGAASTHGTALAGGLVQGRGGDGGIGSGGGGGGGALTLSTAQTQSFGGPAAVWIISW